MRFAAPAAAAELLQVGLRWWQPYFSVAGPWLAGFVQQGFGFGAVGRIARAEAEELLPVLRGFRILAERASESGGELSAHAASPYARSRLRLQPIGAPTYAMPSAAISMAAATASVAV